MLIRASASVAVLEVMIRIEHEHKTRPAKRCVTNIAQH